MNYDISLSYLNYKFNTLMLFSTTHTLIIGTNWKIISGHKEGQTQVDSPAYDSRTWWCHPIDIHFASKGIQGMLYLLLFQSYFNNILI